MSIATHDPVAAPSRAELVEHLQRWLIAGDVATPREDNLRKYGYLAARMPNAMFGLRLDGTWTLAEILALMVEKVGVSPDPSYLHGPDRIDPDRTVDGLDRMAAAVRDAARPGARVVVATGHPAGLLPVHQEVVRALQQAGATVLTPAAGTTYTVPTCEGSLLREIRYVGGVATVSNRGDLNHTHSPAPMETVLAAVREAGEPPPDLVVADHGWAGAAGQAGVRTVGFADSNDPALFVGEAEGRVEVSVPLDDNVAPHLYAPLTAYLLAAAGLA